MQLVIRVAPEFTLMGDLRRMLGHESPTQRWEDGNFELSSQDGRELESSGPRSCPES